MLKHAEAAALMKAVATVIREHVGKALDPILARLAAIEARPAPEKGEPGADGASVTLDDVQPVIQAALDGFSSKAMALIAAIPKPKDGRDGVDGKDGAPGKDGADGKSVAAEDVLPVLRGDLKAYLDSIPIPKDGKDGAPGKDGADGKSITVDDVVPILERKMAEWALDFERRAQETLQRAIDRIPVPKDGAPGKDGRDGVDGKDGLGIEDFHWDLDVDAGEMVLVFERGDVRKEFRKPVPVMVDRGVFKAGEQYRQGNSVTWGGSSWIAQKHDPAGKPGESADWRLSVKKGRDGKDGAPGKDGKDGKDGKSWVKTDDLNPR